MTAPAIAPSAQELYRLEKERRAGRVSPAMEAARRVLQRLEEEALEAKKGGRPKNPFQVGKGTRPRALRLEPDLAPGRPDWMPGYTPSIDNTPLPPPTMSKTEATRTAIECGHPVSPFGPRPKLCLDCKASDAVPAKKPKADKKETKRKPVRTGFVPETPSSTPAKPSSGLALTSSIDAIKEELKQLDDRRAELRSVLREALEQLQELADA